jgi:hypothetical protein
MTQDPPADQSKYPPEGIDTTTETKQKALVQEILLSLLRIEQNIKKIESLLDKII